MPRNLILRYTQPGDVVLDPMCGSGTTLVEARLLGRNAMGIDINRKAVEMSRARLQFEPGLKVRYRQTVRLGDARDLESIPAASIDLVTLHPPYFGIIRYSDEPSEGDLSWAPTLDAFFADLGRIAAECARVVRPGGHVGMLMGDTRSRGEYLPLAFRALRCFENPQWQLRESIVKAQWNTRMEDAWRARAKAMGFHLIAHEHLFIWRRCSFEPPTR